MVYFTMFICIFLHNVHTIIELSIWRVLRSIFHFRRVSSFCCLSDSGFLIVSFWTTRGHKINFEFLLSNLVLWASDLGVLGRFEGRDHQNLAKSGFDIELGCLQIDIFFKISFCLGGERYYPDR